MKNLITYITEKIKINNDSIESNKIIEVNSKEELHKVIKMKLVDQPEDLDLSDIELGPSIDSLDGLFNGKSVKSIDLTGWNVSNIKKFDGMFANCYNLETIYGIENWQFGDDVSFYKMFYADKNLNDINISNWDVSQVNNLSYMFYGCQNLNIDLSNWKFNPRVKMFNTTKNSNVKC